MRASHTMRRPENARQLRARVIPLYDHGATCVRHIIAAGCVLERMRTAQGNAIISEMCASMFTFSVIAGWCGVMLFVFVGCAGCVFVCVRASYQGVDYCESGGGAQCVVVSVN